MPTRRIVCLANSRKHGGRCIAGLRLDGGGWLRPVGPDRDGELSPNHYTLDDGTEPKILDVIDVTVSRPRPEPHQPENWLIGKAPWKLITRPGGSELVKILRPRLVKTRYLFRNKYDRLAETAVTSRPGISSLTLVEPQQLHWRMALRRGRRQFRATFEYKGTEYDLAITDPAWEQRLGELKLKPDVQYSARAVKLKSNDRVLLTSSLGEPFEGNCYKLVAAVIVLPPQLRDDL